MILLIIFGALTAIGIVLAIVGKVLWSDNTMGVGIILVIIFGLALVFSGGLAIDTQVHKEEQYQDALNEKDTIEYFILQSDTDILRDDKLYNRILNFNERISRTRYRCDSPWVGIWYNEKIATIDYIDVTKLGGK